ncbi:hypothetical protein DY000_02011246 [Brassica cretica]|uniref:Uncharacterized protein n=1 Tax=Brassica cretica TaxID=69181 RepID=A0ABQ7D6A0_BRACR|nr:hypothetical protein DY000_02011246 [Brassica cretica]
MMRSSYFVQYSDHDIRRVMKLTQEDEMVVKEHEVEKKSESEPEFEKKHKEKKQKALRDKKMDRDE